MDLKQLENIYSSNGDFTTRAAILQSWYRVSINEKCGLGNKNIVKGRDQHGKTILDPVKQEYGHLVEGGETRNINFFFQETYEYAKYRVEHKKPEETIKADRLFNNLLSSMPMAFNLFHPLILIKHQYPERLNAMIQNAFPEYPIHKVTDVLIEFIPLPIEQYTGDRSAMDAAILFQDSDRNDYLISIETKYIDQLGKNTAKENALKLETAINSELFNSDGIDTISKGCTQIYRNFLLAEKYRIVHGLRDSYSIILAPADHPTTNSEITSLKENLRPEFQYKIQKYSLEDFIEALKPDCPEEYKNWLNWFYDRYLNFNKTDHLFKEFTNQ
ncbi:MAG: hypothetical protein R6X28_13500 [Bacteroidales bacterium]